LRGENAIKSTHQGEAGAQSLLLCVQHSILLGNRQLQRQAVNIYKKTLEKQPLRALQSQKMLPALANLPNHGTGLRIALSKGNIRCAAYIIL
jgi:hypothetical protein